MAKLFSWVLLIAVGYLVYQFIVLGKRKQDAVRDRAKPEAGSTDGKAPGEELMLRCDHCGVHIPASEVVRAADKHYCSIAHRDAGHDDGHPG